jgi:uncharacterized protein YfcZ (UPF0381/DUF406 family)
MGRTPPPLTNPIPERCARKDQEMAKAYIITSIDGDDCPTPARVYADRVRAEETLAKLDEISADWRQEAREVNHWADQQHVLNGDKWESMEHLVERDRRVRLAMIEPKTISRYASLGFEANCEHTWELVEAELDNA